jgi:7-carboxy-7-deazaguanine synthase
MTIETVLDEVAALGLPLVEVTGGEPLAQPLCSRLLTALCDAGYEVLLETSGALDVGVVDPRVVKIVDVKCPGSGEKDSNRWENLDLLGKRDEVKFVIADRTDFDWACDVVRKKDLASRSKLLFSPVHGELDPGTLGEWIGESRLPARLQIQLHKYVWPGRTREV